MSATPYARPAAALVPRAVRKLRGRVRRRAAAIVALFALPLVAVALLLVARFGGGPFAGALTLFVGGLAATAVGQRILRRYDARWVVRRLEAAQPAFEDSLDLLLDGSAVAGAGAGALGLVELQRQRVASRLETIPAPDLQPAVPRRALGIVWFGAACVAAAALWGSRLWASWLTAAASTPPTVAAPGGLSASLQVEPPAYTGLGAQTVTTLDAKVPEGSRVSFALRMPAHGAAPAHVALAFDDGSRSELHADAGTGVWRGALVVTASRLYRVEIDGAPVAPDRPNRLEMIPDRPPRIVVHTPEHTLSQLATGQKTWELAFEADDDYGLGPAELTIAHAQGSGENIKTTQQTVLLDGDGDARHRAYRKTLDLSALGFAEGDDLVVRLSVADNRPGTPNRTQSASFILRWPTPNETPSAGMEGLVQRTLPAYFTSERQLIIDSEALVAQRAALAADRFAARADELGVEQKTLRLRYGEFLGEESEPDAEHDRDTVPTAKSFGDAGNITAEYGHMHDRPEAATLLDPDTRRLLKGALGEMWQAELNLRQAAPEQALPYEYRALEFIKQVQQAERIYLARAGVQLPQVDPSRRLTGERAGLTDHDLTEPAAQPPDSPIPALWGALRGGGATPDWAAFTAWVRAHQSTLPAALDLLAAADRVQHDPACTGCRTELLARLWPLLPPPGAALQPREQPDAEGQAYLEALEP
jgi:hypothetical protein